MTEKSLEKQTTDVGGKQLLQSASEAIGRKGETENCHFIPELNRIDFFSRVRASHLQSRSSKLDLFTQTASKVGWRQ